MSEPGIERMYDVPPIQDVLPPSLRTIRMIKMTISMSKGRWAKKLNRSCNHDRSTISSLIRLDYHIIINFFLQGVKH